ncbi:hypothetical protein B0O80DRAFT_438965, partial [Mortierella sp. GBAus27b]
MPPSSRRSFFSIQFRSRDNGLLVFTVSPKDVESAMQQSGLLCLLFNHCSPQTVGSIACSSVQLEMVPSCNT